MRIQASFSTALVVMLLVACGNLSVAPEPANPATNDEPITALARGVVVDDGTLMVGGDDTANEIRITYSHEGMHVQLDGQEELFRKPIRNIIVDAGYGDNIVEYHQSIVADIALGIVTGDGDDVIDVEFDLIDPPDGRILAFAVDVDTGGGAGRVKVQFSWDAADPQFDFAADVRPGGGPRFTPEIGDEVIIAMKYGDLDQPIIVGAVYNSVGAAADTGQPRLGLRNLARALSVVTELQFTGGQGNDELDVYADYSGVRLQQGRVDLDADFNEGDNRFSGNYFVTSATHTNVVNRITAGDGDNEIHLTAHELSHTLQQRPGRIGDTPSTILESQLRLDTTDYDFIHHLEELGYGDNVLESRKGGSIIVYDYSAGHGNNHLLIEEVMGAVSSSTYQIDLGDGDNHTEIRFGDGVHGRQPPTGQSTVNATYRSGTGSDTIVIEGEANGPVAAKFVLAPGGENNQFHGKYIFGDWSTGLTSGTRVTPSQVKVLLLTPIDKLDFRIEEPPPADAPGRPAEFVIVAIGQKTRGTLDYLKTIGDPALPAGSDLEFKYAPVRRTFTFEDVIADDLSLTMVHGDNRVSKDMGDITLKRAVTESNEIALEELAIAHEGFHVELEGLEVLGSFALEKELQAGASSSTVLRDVHVHQGASASYDGVDIIDISDPAPPSSGWFRNSPTVSLAIHDLQIDGTFTATTQTATAGKVQMQDFHFVMRHNKASIGLLTVNVSNSPPDPASPDLNLKGSEILQISAFEISDLMVLERGEVAIAMNAGDISTLLSYIQDRVHLAAGATMDVQLSGGSGDDAMAALLREIAGEGSFRFITDGGSGDDFVTVLARNLDPGDEDSMSFEVLGGEGNDILALAVPAEPVRTGTISARIDGGRGFNSCFATLSVLIENCDRHLNGSDILRLLRRHLAPLTAIDTLNSKEYTDEWSTAH